MRGSGFSREFLEPGQGDQAPRLKPLPRGWGEAQGESCPAVSPASSRRSKKHRKSLFPPGNNRASEGCFVLELHACAEVRAQRLFASPGSPHLPNRNTP